MKSNERRHHPRVDVGMSALVPSRDGRLHLYLVEDLSVGGALLRGGPALAVGQVIRVCLRLGQNDSLVVEALTVRQIAEGGAATAMAIAFRNLTAKQEDDIQDAILNALEALNPPRSAVRQRATDEVGDVADERVPAARRSGDRNT